MHSVFLSKVAVNELLHFPQQSPMGESCPLTIYIFFYISLKFVIKMPLNKKIYPFSQRP